MLVAAVAASVVDVVAVAVVDVVAVAVDVVAVAAVSAEAEVLCHVLLLTILLDGAVGGNVDFAVTA